MKQKAIEKLTAECEKFKNSKYYEEYVAIEENYTKVMNDRIAEKILQEEKTVKGAYEHLVSYAKAHRIEFISDKRGFVIIDEYYGIRPEDYSDVKVMNTLQHDSDDFDDILDLL